MSKELAKQESQEIDVFAGLGDLEAFKTGSGQQIVGLETIDSTDMKLPKYRLLQSNSIEVTKGGFKAGQFYNTVTKTAVDKLNVILLALGKSRVMWPEKFKRGDEPTCRSFDNVHSFDGVKMCANCAFADWEKAKTEGKNKPDCNMSYVWLGVDMESKAPFRITMGGMSVGPTKDFLNQIAPKRLPAFVYHTEITTKQEENENGVFYTAQYKITGVIQNAEYKELEDLSIGMKSLFMTAIQNDTLHNDEAAGAEGGQATGTNNVLF